MFTNLNWRGGRCLFSTAVSVMVMMLFVALLSQASAVDLMSSAESAAIPVQENILSAGGYHTCGLRPDGSVKCWGASSGTFAGPFKQVSAGLNGGCGLKIDGSVDCFSREAGDAPGPFKQISTGKAFDCGLKPDGSVDCSPGETMDAAGPFTQISAGWSHICGLTPERTVQCWGEGPPALPYPDSERYLQVAAGYYETCGLRVDGNVYCFAFGAGHYDYSLAGPFVQISIPLQGFLDQELLPIQGPTCGLKADGSVTCRGAIGDFNQDGPFTQISVGGGWEDYDEEFHFANTAHVCGLKSDGSVECWGNNEFGQSTNQEGPFGPYVPTIGDVPENGRWVEVGASASQGGISASSGDSYRPDLAVGPDSMPVVAWYDETNGNKEIYAKSWDGLAWTEIGDSGSGGGISNSSKDSWNPSVAISPDGTPYIAWEEVLATDENGRDETEIYVRRWNGTNWVAVGSGSAATGMYSWRPSLAISPNGTPIMAWEAQSEIYVRQWNGSAWVAMGSGSDSGGGISNTGGGYYFGSDSPSLALGADGSAIVAWSDYASGNFEIYARRWNGSTWEEMGSGSASGGGISDLGGDSTGPSAAIGPDGTPIIAWTYWSGGDAEIYVRRWNGAAWEEIGSGSASGGGISDNDGDSYAPSVAINPDGTPIVAWQDSTIGEAEIYMRHWNGSSWVEMGTGSASYGGVSDNIGNSEAPSLAVGPDGVPLVAWHDDRIGNREIYLKQWQPTIEADSGMGEWSEMGGGSASGGGISDASGSSVTPSMAAGPDGNPVIAWEDNSSGNTEIYVRRWNGSNWVEMGSGSASGGGISNNVGSSRHPSLAIGPDGMLIVAWDDDSEDCGGSCPAQIYVRRWNGSDWVEMGSGSASGGGITDNDVVSLYPSLAIGPDGTPIIAMHEFFATMPMPEIHVLRWNGSGWAAMGGSVDQGLSDSSTRPSLAISPDNAPIVAWENFAGDNEIYLRRWNGSDWVEMGSGSASDGGISNSSGDSFNPSLSIDSEGRPVVAWEDNSAGEYEIYVRRWNGTSWEEMGSGSASGSGISAAGENANQIAQVSSPSDNGTTHPSMAMGADGAAVIAWTELAGGNLEIYARRWNGRAWSEFGDSASGGGISDTSGLSSAPAVAIGHAGAPVIAWEDSTSGKMQIYLRRWQPGYALYFPAQEMEPGLGWKAGMQVQNKGTAEASMFFSGYGAGGEEVECEKQTAAPGASVTFLTNYSCPSGHAPFSAAVIRAEQPAVAIANVNNRGVGLAAGQYRGIYEGESDTQVFFPLVKNEHVGRTTGFFVQNASEGPLDMVAVFRVQGQYQEKQYKNVPPNSSIFVLPGDANVPPGLGQVGSLTVVAPGPIAGSAVEFDAGVSIADNLQASRGFTPAEADNTLYCPLFRNAHAKRLQTTGVQVQNVTEAAQRIDFTYVPVDGGQTVTASEQVAPGASATFYAPHLGIPAGSLGAVTLEGEGDLVAVVNDQGFDKGQRNVAAYSCFPAGQATKRVHIPLYKEMYQGNTTGIQVQNVAGDGSGAKVTLTYRVSNSSTVVVFTHENPIPDGGSITFWGVSSLAQPQGIKLLSGDASLLEKTVGSVEIVADQPIVAIANETSYGADASGQDAKNYEGFNN